MVDIPHKNPPSRHHVYVVTNAHVVRDILRRPGCIPTIRMNRKDGGVGYFEKDTWTFHPNGDDLCVAYLDVPIHEFKASAPTIDAFITKAKIQEHGIGPGDEIFLVGRFISHDGRERNYPSSRFGNIAMMPHEPIFNSYTGLNQESFLIELRSLSGYSGSPVFVFTMPWFPRPGASMASSRSQGPFLLGIDWGHFADFKPVLNKDKRTFAEPHCYVGQNSGFAGVVPAWKLQEVLDMPELRGSRQQREKGVGEV